MNAARDRAEMDSRANALLADVDALLTEPDQAKRQDLVLAICAGYRTAEMLSLIVRLRARP